MFDSAVDLLRTTRFSGVLPGILLLMRVLGVVGVYEKKVCDLEIYCTRAYEEQE